MLRFTGSEPNLCAQVVSEHSTGMEHFATRSVAYPRSPFVHPSVPSPLLAKIARLVRLTAEEIARLEELSRAGACLAGEQLLIRQGESATHAFLITDGMAIRYRVLAGGKRQILSYLIPGDICGVRCSEPNRSDHDVVTLDGARVQMIDLKIIAQLVTLYPAVGRAFALASLADSAILREWLFNVGQRNSVQRLCHFFCEMSVRLAVVGKVDGNGSFAFPLSQALLADTIGLTSVHINRTLQRLRSCGLIALRHGRLTIIDRVGLAQMAGFDENYLNIMRCEE